MTIRDESIFTAEFYATDLHTETADLLRRIEDGHQLNALRLVGYIQEQTVRVERALVLQLRTNGISWTEIAAVTGLTRQGASQRYSDLE